MAEIDDELQGLLEELDIGPEVGKEEPMPVSAPVEQPSEPPPQLPTPILEAPDPAEKELDVDLFDEEEMPPGVTDLQEFVRKHDRDYEEVKTNLRADRAKADEVVRLLLERVAAGAASNQETESLVQAVKCLVDSNGHMVRLLDSKSKLLSASKGTVGAIIQQNFGSGKSDPNLEAILSQQLDEDQV